MRHIIIDGYNVIRADPRFQSFERVSLEHARDVLVQTLASAPRLANDRVMVVFDGRNGTRGHTHAQRRGRIDILYSGQGQTADAVIIAQAQQLAGTGRVVVVTNDVEVREACRAEGCEISGSENLLGQIPGRPRRMHGETGDDGEGTLSTVKRGNPRRAPRGARQKREIRF